MSMQEYKVKRGKTTDLEQRIKTGFVNIFGVEPSVSGNHFVIVYGSLKKLEVWAGEKNKTLIVDSITDEAVFNLSDDEANKIILDTNKKFRQFLDLTTGFTTKERVKRAKK